jgi:uncharacterized membrane protein YbhN (UPF0104 family)
MPKKIELSAVWTVLKIVLAFLLIGFVLSRMKMEDLYGLHERISLPWLGLMFLLFAFLPVLKAAQYYILLDRRVEFPAVLNVVVVQNAVSNFIATSAGIALYISMFRMEKSVKVGRSVIVFLLTKVGDLITVSLFLLVSGLLSWQRVQPIHSLVVLVLASIALVIGMFFITVFFRESFVRLLRMVVDALHVGRIGFVARGLDLLASLAAQDHRLIFGMVGLGVIYSALYQSLSLLWAYATLRVFEFEVGFVAVVFVNAFLQLISYLPIQAFGGLGIAEGASMYLYAFFGATQAEVVPVLIGCRILFYLLNLLLLLYLPAYSLFFKRRAKSTHAS